jgi:drug/metabolite transporter (DMT)-like permease
MTNLQPLYTWAGIAILVLASTVGNVLMSKAMRHGGDLTEIYRRRGVVITVKSVLTNPTMLAAIGFMAVSFFTLLFALSWGDVSLVVPAAASLTFVSNAVAAKIFLKETVDRRRWAAAVLICIGVALLAE